MTGAAFSLERRIREAYEKSGNVFGWRFLSSPAGTLDSAEVALIDQNPGGDHQPDDHSEFAMEKGSAYEEEKWGHYPPGNSPLQIQVRTLFERLQVESGDVLAGHLVPFRSPSWSNLKNRKEAIEFGKEIWKEVLDRARPELVVALGAVARDPVKEILEVHSSKPIPLNWKGRAAERGKFDGGRFVYLPHFSRCPVMRRPESKEPLDRLFR